VQRTTAGTQGLVRTAGSGLALAASCVTAGATARALVAAGVEDVVFVVTGVSHDRDGDEDLACAELIAARVAGEDPDPAPYLARVAASDWGQHFRPEGPAWAPPADLALACELDRFTFAVVARWDPDLRGVELRRGSEPAPLGAGPAPAQPKRPLM
jgi:2-phosphosulfolactate phosphatase